VRYVGRKVADRFLKGGGSRVGWNLAPRHDLSIQDKGLRSQVYNLADMSLLPKK
jgi:hypothetical protein